MQRILFFTYKALMDRVTLWNEAPRLKFDLEPPLFIDGVLFVSSVPVVKFRDWLSCFSIPRKTKFFTDVLLLLCIPTSVGVNAFGIMILLQMRGKWDQLYVSSSTLSL